MADKKTLFEKYPLGRLTAEAAANVAALGLLSGAAAGAAATAEGLAPAGPAGGAAGPAPAAAPAAPAAAAGTTRRRSSRITSTTTTAAPSAPSAPSASTSVPAVPAVPAVLAAPTASTSAPASASAAAAAAAYPITPILPSYNPSPQPAQISDHRYAFRLIRGNPPLGVAPADWARAYNRADTRRYNIHGRKGKKHVADREDGTTRSDAVAQLIRTGELPEEYVDGNY